MFLGVFSQIQDSIQQLGVGRMVSRKTKKRKKEGRTYYTLCRVTNFHFFCGLFYILRENLQ